MPSANVSWVQVAYQTEDRRVAIPPIYNHDSWVWRLKVTDQSLRQKGLFINEILALGKQGLLRYLLDADEEHFRDSIDATVKLSLNVRHGSNVLVSESTSDTNSSGPDMQPTNKPLASSFVKAMKPRAMKTQAMQP